MIRPDEPSSTNIKILYVDDDKDHLRLTKTVLEKINHSLRVTSIESPENALKELEKKNFDCILIDYVMPKLDGLQLAEKIRQKSDTPIILYTGQGSEDVAKQAFKIGVDNYIRKETHPAHYQVLAQNIQNIVKKHRVNTRLRGFERQLKSILDNMLEGCQIIDTQYRYRYLNNMASRHGRRAKEELLGRTMMECYPDIENTEMFHSLTKCMKEGIPVQMENLFKYPDGSTAWFELSFKPIPEGAMILSIDVTEREETLQRFGESDRRYRMLVEGSSLPMSVTIGDRIVYVNKKRLELTGHTDPATLIKTSSLDHVHPDDRALILRRLKAEDAGECVPPVTWFQLTRVDGATVYVEDHVSDGVWMGEKAIIHCLVDITERVRYEGQLEALHRHSHRLVTAGNFSEIGETTFNILEDVFGFDTGSFIRVRGGFLETVYAKGINVENVRSLPLDGPGIIVRAIKTGETQCVADVRQDEDYVLGLGEEGYEILSELAVPVKTSGKVVAVINIESEEPGAFTEEDRRLVEIFAEHVASALRSIRAAEERRRYEERLEALSRVMGSMNTAQSLGELVDQTLAIVEEVIGVPFSAYMLVEGDELVTFRIRGAPLTGVRLSINGTGITARAAREKRPILVGDTRLDSDFVKGSTDSLSELDVPVVTNGEVVGVLNMESLELDYFDASHVSLAEALASHVSSNLERLKHFKEVQEMERTRAREAVESVAKIGSMVRHDLRGPLAAIGSAVHLLKGNPEDTKLREIIDRSVSRAAEILEDLRERTWTGSLTPAPTDLVGLIRETVEGLGAPEGVNVTLKLHDGVNGMVDGAKMRRVVENLVLNAFDAMPDGGELRVEEQVNDGCLVLRVSDTGVGIPSEILSKLFTPFFTTKKSGTGLGLVYCRQVVEAHGGTVSVESEAGRGTSFTVKLPLG